MTPSNATGSILFTIGHSNHDLGDFLAILVHHGVEALCDVRSRPGSFRFPQFNREPLEAAAGCAKIQYQFLGEALGGRPEDPRVYHSNGQVDYVARRKSPDFSAGVERLRELSRSANIALMCAERRSAPMPPLPDDLPRAHGAWRPARTHAPRRHSGIAARRRGSFA
jgi:uncharacterized protein (DUF488 family)